MANCMVLSASKSREAGVVGSAASTTRGSTVDLSSSGPLQLWDPVTGGNLVQFKGSAAAMRGLAAVHGAGSGYTLNQRDGCDFFLLSQADKPAVHSWTWGRSQPHFKCAMPEKIGPLATTNDGVYCFGGGSSGRIYVWDVATGALLKEAHAHQGGGVRVLRVTSDGSCVVSGGEDAVIHVWSVVHLVDLSANEGTGATTTGATSNIDPLCSWTGHGLPVTDIFCGYGGINGHVWSSSMDHTCKVWSILSKKLLFNIACPSSIESIVADPEEKFFYSGGGDGKIYVTQIKTVARHDESIGNRTISPEKQALAGHTGRVNCLAMTPDGAVLISGGQDGIIVLWDIHSRISTKRLSMHNGPVTNLLVLPRPADLFRAKASDSFLSEMVVDRKTGKNDLRPFAPFKKHMHSHSAACRDFSVLSTLPVKRRTFMASDDLPTAVNPTMSAKNSTVVDLDVIPIKTDTQDGDPANNEEDVQKLRAEIAALKEQNERWQRVALELQEMVGDEAVGKNDGKGTASRGSRKRRKQ